mmetsp:Transcript_110148/g.179706  ORF Transcript_110148/g.179706 Transcript_110148/m.179706 type:complete len:281 (+) Transcript_110148:80-922(+)
MPVDPYQYVEVKLPGCDENIKVREVEDAPTGCMVWPAARVLLHWLSAGPGCAGGPEEAAKAGATLLELGAGTGYLALGLAATGCAAKVYAADGDSQTLDNMHLNLKTSAGGEQVQPVYWDWVTNPQVPEDIAVDKLDLIIGSDIVFGRYYDEKALAAALRTLLSDSRARAGLEAILILADRWKGPEDPNPEVSDVDLFLMECRGRKLLVRELTLSAEVLEDALGPVPEGCAAHEDPGGATGTTTTLRLFKLAAPCEASAAEASDAATAEAPADAAPVTTD